MFCMCMRLFCVCVVLCLGRGLATGQSLVRGVLSSVKMINETKKSAVCSEVRAKRKEISQSIK
jgi:hypothetical protein